MVYARRWEEPLKDGEGGGWQAHEHSEWRATRGCDRLDQFSTALSRAAQLLPM